LCPYIIRCLVIHFHYIIILSSGSKHPCLSTMPKGGHSPNPIPHTFSLRGIFFKTMDREIVDSVITWDLAKHTCRILQNSIILICFDYNPPNQILDVSLNGFRKWVTTHHKNLTETWINEPFIVFDSWHHIIAMGTALP